ncbi:hypothetical protein Tco_0038779 [Tanacetum coccineum]
MSTPTFAATHNLIAFLEKPTESKGFEQIIDFLKAKPINYALTMNPKVYTSCIKQFWATAKVKKVNGTDCLPNATIFEELARIGYEKPSQSFCSCIKQFWATAKVKKVNGKDQIQALIDKQKAIITEESIRRDIHFGDAKVLLDKQLEGMSKRKETFVITSHTKKVFANMRRQADQFFGRVTPLFDTMMVQASEEVAYKNNVLDLEQAKTAQAKENVTLKKRVKKLERRRRSRLTRLRRSRKGRSIKDIDVDAEVTLLNETQETQDDLMFDVGILDDEVVITGEKEEQNTKDEMSLAQTLIEIKASKIKAVTTAATIVTTATTTRPKAKGIVMQEPSERSSKQPIISTQKPSQPKDKGKAKMVEPEKPLKKIDQVTLDEQIARDLDSQLQAELIEEERINRQKKEEANIALIESWEIHKL